MVVTLETHAKKGPLIAARTLAVVLLVATALAWTGGGMNGCEALEALSADRAVVAAAGRGDLGAVAREGARRLELRVRPASPAFRIAVAYAMIRTGHRLQGIAVAEDVLGDVDREYGEDAPAAAGIRNNLAWFLVTLPDPNVGQLERALALADRALASDEDNPFYLGTWATVKLRLGELEDAREALERALNKHTVPDAKATDRAILAIVLAKLGEPDAARAAFEAAKGEGRPDEMFVKEAVRLLGD